MGDKVTRESFLADVSEHEIRILLDNGVYRHIRCQAPNSWIMGFEIVTFPCSLVYTGDMGSFTFQRIQDMFQFFRRNDGEINPMYWSEKVQSQDRDGVTRFSRDTFRENVLNDVRGQLDLEEDDEVPADIISQLERAGVFSHENESESVDAARGFRHHRINLTDFWEHDNTVYTSRFLWCCHAIVWAIGKYDETKEPTNG